jgi:hypothetical protein
MEKARTDRCSLGRVAFHKPICSLRASPARSQSRASHTGVEGPMRRLALVSHGLGGQAIAHAAQRERVLAVLAVAERNPGSPASVSARGPLAVGTWGGQQARVQV